MKSLFAFRVEYFGTSFRGWEGNEYSVRYAIEKALGKTLNDKITCFCAGRTDVGVHGLGQIIHIRHKTNRTGLSIEKGANFYLKKWKKNCRIFFQKEDHTFHARFSAQWRQYRYYMIEKSNILLKDLCLDINGSFNMNKKLHKKINWDLMAEGCKSLIGYYDISSFCPKNYEKRRMRTVLNARLCTEEFLGEKVYFLEVTSLGFAYHQVRYMVGSLLYLGKGIQSLEEFKQNIIDKKPLYLAPSTGLILFRVGYRSYN